MLVGMAHRPLSLASAVVVATAAVLLAVPAAAAVSDWSSGAKAKMRLLAAGIDADGRLSAAIEITLPTGWETYWRFPGDAGLAPIIGFSASHNLGVAEVSFPLPQRVSEAALVTNVYSDHVVLPVSAAVLDPQSPVDLTVSVDLGVCQNVCVPDHVEAHLVVPPGKTDPIAAKAIADARATVPGPPRPGVLAVNAVTRTGGTDKSPVFQVAITAPDAANATVFVETPTDWYPEAPTLLKASGNTATFTLGADRLTADTPLANAAFRVTVAAGGQSIEQIVLLQ
jgi:DsbC/DsbD-like thiol-disulfide interchange protein